MQKEREKSRSRYNRHHGRRDNRLIISFTQALVGNEPMVITHVTLIM